MTGQEMADVLRERLYANRGRAVTLESWEVDYIIAKLEAAEDLSEAVYDHHHVQCTYENMMLARKAYNNVDGEGKT